MSDNQNIGKRICLLADKMSADNRKYFALKQKMQQASSIEEQNFWEQEFYTECAYRLSERLQEAHLIQSMAHQSYAKKNSLIQKVYAGIAAFLVFTEGFYFYAQEKNMPLEAPVAIAKSVSRVGSLSAILLMFGVARQNKRAVVKVDTYTSLMAATLNEIEQKKRIRNN